MNFHTIIIINNNLLPARPWCGNANIIVIEFTGLKDKNGKEIYEGDIVKYEIVMDIFKAAEKHKHVIEWIKDPWIGWNFPSYTQNGLKVIGNIYENPELIK